MQMLAQQGHPRTTKWRFAAEPLIDHHPKGVLIALLAGMMLDLFGSHVQRGPCRVLLRKGVQGMLDHGEPKIAEQHLVVGIEQEIGRLDITMDHALLVSIVHHQVRRLCHDPEVIHPNNMGMVQLCDGTRLAPERLKGGRLHLHMQDFDRGRSFQVEVFAQIDRSKAPLPKQTEQAVVAKLLSHTISHTPGLFPRSKDRAYQKDLVKDAESFSEKMPCLS